MKKVLAVGLGIALLLTGCGGQKDAESAKPPKPAVQQPTNAPQKDENGQIVFTAAGQQADVPNVGHVTLKKIKTVNETVDLKPIKVTIQDIKLFHVEKLNPQLKQGIAQLSGKPVGENLDYIQVQLSAENTSDDNVVFAGIATITTNTGQQIEVAQSDFIVDDDMQMPDYLGKVKKEGIIAVPVKNPDQIKHLKLFFDMVSNQNGDTLKDSQKVEYDL